MFPEEFYYSLKTEKSHLQEKEKIKYKYKFLMLGFISRVGLPLSLEGDKGSPKGLP